MNRKTINRVNGGIAIYYGILSVMGAVGALVGIGIWLFKVYAGLAEFSWEILTATTVITVILGAIGYSILRVGYEQIEK